MKIGILEADQLSETLRRQYGSYGDMIQNLLQSLDQRLAFTRYQVTESNYPENIDDCDAYLITGSKFSIYDNEPWIKDLQEYVIALAGQQKKLIGICFGHQLIAHALGGQTQKSEKGNEHGLCLQAVDGSGQRYFLITN